MRPDYGAQPGRAPANAQGTVDAARISGGPRTPEQRLDYALMDAARRERGATAAARAQREAAGKPAPAKRRYHAACEAAHAQWTAEVAAAADRYARALNAKAPARSRDRRGSAYNLGWSDGADMLVPEITHRPGSCDDSQWREYAAGYAEGAATAASLAQAIAGLAEAAAQTPGGIAAMPRRSARWTATVARLTRPPKATAVISRRWPRDVPMPREAGLRDFPEADQAIRSVRPAPSRNQPAAGKTPISPERQVTPRDT